MRRKADRICDLLLPMNQHGAEGTESFVVSAVLHRKDDKDVVEVVASLCGALRIHQLPKLPAVCFHSIRIQSLSMSFKSKSR